MSKASSTIEKFRAAFGSHPVPAADLRRDNPALARRMADFLDANRDELVREIADKVTTNQPRKEA